MWAANIKEQLYKVYVMGFGECLQSLPHKVFSEISSHEETSALYKVPRTLFEAREVAGSATYKQSKTVSTCIGL